MIGFFDSGLGGFSVLREVVKLLPGERYTYYADSANCPYGEKSVEFIQERARSISSLLMGRGAGIIVVACNTATAAAIGSLRSQWPDFPFVGMEPAVKPAALQTHSGVIGVLATAGTLKGGNYLDLRDKYSDKVKVCEMVGRGFVETVEKGIPDPDEARATVRAAVQPLIDSGADTIVLGCTHYPFLTDYIREVAGEGTRIIDPAPAVARQVLRVYESLKEAAGPAVQPQSEEQGTHIRQYRTARGAEIDFISSSDAPLPELFSGALGLVSR